MSLVRTGLFVFALTASLVTVACSGSEPSGEGGALTPAAAPEETGETSSALVLSEVEGAATLDVASEDGTCTDLRTLLESKKDALKSLCADGQIPVPVKGNREGCEKGQVIEVTFECRAINRPPMPKEGCKDLEVKSEGAEVDEEAELDGALVCPRLGGAPEGATEDRPKPPLPPKGGDAGRPPPRGPKGIRCCAPPKPKTESTEG